MSAKVGRNDPCPCGSGKKYKQCHLGKDDDPAQRDRPLTTEEVAIASEEAAAPPHWTVYVPWVIGIVGALGAVGLFATRGPKEGGAVIGGTLLLMILWVVLGKPPPPKDDAGDPAALNFGRRD